MTEYICKCGKEIQKSTDADVTGNRLENYALGHECFGCPYVVEVQKWTKYPEFEIIHECEMSSHILNLTTCSGFGNNNNSCAVLSLDFDFLREVADYCLADEHLTINREENGNIFGYKSSYQANGLYRLPIYPTSNKAGVAAKKALFEQFFNEDGTRKDTCGDDETEIVQSLIARGKVLAQMEIAPEKRTEERTETHACVSEPEETHEERTEQPRTTLVASPLDFASATLAPAFDYSDLDPKTVATLHVAESLIFDARKYYLAECANAVGIAHDALCSTVVQQLENGKFAKKEDTFLAWCESVGLKKSNAYKFLQVNNLIKNATEEEQAILEAAPKTLLYAAANPNAPADLVQGVKDGDITTNADYQKLLREKQDLEQEKAQLENDVQCLDENLTESLKRGHETTHKVHEAELKAIKAEEQAQQAKRDFKTVSDVVTQKTAENARLRREAFEATEREQELERKVRELEARPVDVAVQQPSAADIERYRKEGEAAAAAEWKERCDYIEAQNQYLNDAMREREEVALTMQDAEYDTQDEVAAFIYGVGKRAAETVESALALFFETAYEQPDIVYRPALQFLLETHEKFTTAINTGRWFYDVEEVEDELE